MKIHQILILSFFGLGASAGFKKRRNGNWYSVISKDEITWVKAKKAAAKVKFCGAAAHLATITSRSENKFVQGLVYTNPDVLDEYWLGGFQEPKSSESTGNWTWVNDEGSIPGPYDGSAKYQNWKDGEPNDAGDRGEQYLAMAASHGTWNDEGDGAKGNTVDLIKGYIVEIENEDVDMESCGDQLVVDAACPCSNGWKNHGQYMKCVKRAAEDLKEHIISERDKSSCGKKKVRRNLRKA